MGRKREDEGYLREDEEYFVCDVLCEGKKINGEQVKQDQRFTVLLRVS